MSMVQDMMSTEINAVSPSTPVIEVAHQMKVRGTGVIPVCDDGKFRGLITERDIVINVVAAALDPVTECAGSVMSKRQPVVSPDDDILQAANVMVDNGVRVLPVVEGGNLVGLFTLEHFARQCPSLAAVVFNRLQWWKQQPEGKAIAIPMQVEGKK